jgi:hypothetical protein
MSRPSIADALGHGRDSDGELERDEIVPRRESPGTDGTATAAVTVTVISQRRANAVCALILMLYVCLEHWVDCESCLWRDLESSCSLPSLISFLLKILRRGQRQ